MSLKLKPFLTKNYLYLLIGIVAVGIVIIHSYYFVLNANLLSLYTDQIMSDIVKEQAKHYQEIVQITQTGFTWTLMSFSLVSYLKREMLTLKKFSLFLSIFVLLLVMIQIGFYFGFNPLASQRLNLFGLTLASYVMTVLWHGLLLYLSKRSKNIS